ncbi:unnamed protein product [Cochlearia groenlandica]
MFHNVYLKALLLIFLINYLSQIDVSSAQYSQYSQSSDSPDSYLRPHNAARATTKVKPLKWDFKNLAFGGGDMSPAQAVAMWIGEKSYYDYYSNSCHGPACGHYTQIVWRGSARLGCGKAKCGSGASIIVCNYDPAGNYMGTKPY